MTQTELSPEVRALLGPGRLGRAREGLAYSPWFRCPECRRHGQASDEATTGLLYVYRPEPGGPVAQWALLRAHAGCAPSQGREWPDPTVMVWRLVEPIDGVQGSGDEPPAHDTWRLITDIPGGQLPVVVFQRHVVEGVFKIDHGPGQVDVDPEGVMVDPYEQGLIRRGAGWGVRLAGAGDGEQAFARHLAGWRAELRGPNNLTLLAPGRVDTDTDDETAPFIHAAGDRGLPAGWYDLTTQTRKLVFATLPPETVSPDLPGDELLHDPHLRWLSASRGGLHGGLVDIDHHPDPTTVSIATVLAQVGAAAKDTPDA